MLSTKSGVGIISCCSLTDIPQADKARTISGGFMTGNIPFPMAGDVKKQEFLEKVKFRFWTRSAE